MALCGASHVGGEPMLAAKQRRFAPGWAIFLGLSFWQSSNCCIFGHIHHIWRGSTQESHENPDGEGLLVRIRPAIDSAHAVPVAIAKQGGPIVPVDEFERMTAQDAPATAWEAK
jgi:hypothetical protein